MKGIAKAIVGSVVAGIGALGTGMVTAAQTDGVSSSEWWVILGGTLIAASGAFGAVWKTTNTPA